MTVIILQTPPAKENPAGLILQRSEPIHPHRAGYGRVVEQRILNPIQRKPREPMDRLNVRNPLRFRDADWPAKKTSEPPSTILVWIKQLNSNQYTHCTII
jgi:hypothetical protein